VIGGIDDAGQRRATERHAMDPHGSRPELLLYGVVARSPWDRLVPESPSLRAVVTRRGKLVLHHAATPQAEGSR
jgi:hypothetical protein